jgi:hypothetical protein
MGRRILPRIDRALIADSEIPIEPMSSITPNSTRRRAGTVHARRFRATRMLRLGRRRRDVAAQALREMGNLVGGGLVVGQFIGRGSFSVPLLLGGIIAWVLFAMGAVVCTKEEDNG